MSALADDLHHLAELLDQDAVYDFVAGAITDARDKAARVPGDRDSGEVLTEVIAALRAAT